MTGNNFSVVFTSFGMFDGSRQPPTLHPADAAVLGEPLAPIDFFPQPELARPRSGRAQSIRIASSASVALNEPTGSGRRLLAAQYPRVSHYDQACGTGTAGALPRLARWRVCFDGRSFGSCGSCAHDRSDQPSYCVRCRAAASVHRMWSCESRRRHSPLRRETL